MYAARKTYFARFGRAVLVGASCGVICLAPAACTGSKEPSGVKPASAYRADLRAATEKINAYLAHNTPADTPRDELQQAVGKLAQAYPKISAEAAPLQGKTGDPAYGAVAIDAEDGVIVAGNLASALAADPAKHADAAVNLKTATDDWVAFNEALTRDGGETPFNPTRWWEDPVWRDATAAGPPRADDGRREERSPPR
jgi:hypothetical protein